MQRAYFFLTILFLLPVLSCKKKDMPPQADASISKLQGELDNKPFVYTEGISNISVSSFYQPHVISGNSYGTTFESLFLKDTARIYQFSIGSLYYTSYSGVDTASNSDFENYFANTSYTYQDPHKNQRGIAVSLTDSSSGTVFSTINGEQRGSVFNVTAVEFLKYRNTNAVRMTAIFSCNLYDKRGVKKKITNGEVRMYFQNH